MIFRRWVFPVQVILVRDEAAKRRLPAAFYLAGGLVMTILESKGLEFDDCLIYNFGVSDHDPTLTMLARTYSHCEIFDEC